MHKEKTLEELLLLIPQTRKYEFEEILAGKRLPELYYDLPMKTIFHPKNKQKRVLRLFQMLFKDLITPDTLGEEECLNFSLYTKNELNDILMKLSNGIHCEAEEQTAAREYLAVRDDLYPSDVFLLQYTPGSAGTAFTFDFDPILPSYLIFLVNKSPKVFEGNMNYIHYKQCETNTGLVLHASTKTAYAELYKCSAMYKAGLIASDKLELAELLSTIATINDSNLRQHKANSDLQSIHNELECIARNRDQLTEILAEIYKNTLYSVDMLQVKNEGVAEGRADSVLTVLEDYGTVPCELYHAIKTESNLPILSRWLRLAVKVASVTEFIEDM